MGHLDGLAVVVGARTKQTLVGDASSIKSWDSHAAYSWGDVVMYQGYWYRAKQNIDSSWWGNDSPDQSDKWLRISLTDAVLQGDVVGMFDIATEQQKMNSVKPVTVTVAKSMLKYAQAVIAQAIMIADATGLPGPTARKNCQAHLQWHADTLSKVSGPPDSTIYQSGDDLKKWAMQAFIEANSVEEGAQYLDDAWNQMWAEIEDGLAKAPKEILKTVAKLPGQALQAATGIPWWAWYVGIAAGVGLVGFVAYKIATGPVGGAVAGIYLGKRS